MKNNIENGITLIALVITIVILIILAAISINMAFGSNGLITKAQEAKLQQKIAELKEMLNMEKVEVLIEKKGHITIKDYLNHIKEEGIIRDEDIQDTDSDDAKYITVEDEYVFLVENKNGDIEITYQGIVKNLLPRLQINITNITTGSITVKATASAMTNGEYKYYIKNITNGEEYGLKKTGKDREYTFEGLKEKNQYQIKVEAINRNGVDVKESGIIETISIGEIEQQNITFTYKPVGWTNEIVVVTADLTKITIPAGVRVQTSKDARNWENGESQTFSENGEMYVRLYDGTNESNYAVAQVSKIDKEKPVINTVTSTQTTITIEATDETSGIIGYAVTTGNMKPTEFTSVSNTTNLSTTISDLNLGTTYYVWVKDEAGNVSEGKEIATQNYIVTYYIDSGNIQTQAFTTGSSVISGLKFTPNKSGYTFVGWREDTTASSSVLSSKTMGTSNMTLYAVFKKAITLSYNANGGSSTPGTQTGNQYYNNGKIANPTFKLAAAISRTNYKFLGWRMGSNTGTQYAANTSVSLSSNTTFYANWQSIVSPSTKTGSFEARIENWLGGEKLITYGAVYAANPSINLSAYPDNDGGHFSMTTKSVGRATAVIRWGTDSSSGQVRTINWSASGQSYTESTNYTYSTGSFSATIANWTGGTQRVYFGKTFSTPPMIQTAVQKTDWNVTVSNITTTYCDISWGSSSNSGATYTIQWSAEGTI